MPIRLCIDCGNIATTRGRCRSCARTKDHAINRAGYRLYRTKRWRITREYVLLHNPICACGCGRLSTDVHHITDIADGGDPWSLNNLQALTHDCHARITSRRQHTTPHGT